LSLKTDEFEMLVDHLGRRQNCVWDDTMIFTSDHRLIRLPEVKDITGLARATIYRKIQHGKFPRPVKLGRASAWPASEVHKWIEDRIEESRAA
jgi:prophage regulatory protein